MSPIPSKKLFLTSLLSNFLLQVSASPAAAPLSQYAKDALSERATLPVSLTTTTEHHTIDWIPINSQGHIAEPPALLTVFATTSNASFAEPELLNPGAQLGPPGTVPIPRVDPAYLNSLPKKALPDQN